MRLLFLMIICSALSIIAQTNDTTYIHGDSLNIKNIKIFEGWDYNSGDDSSWADPLFSSVDWDVLESRLNNDSLKTEIWNGIGWFRKTIVIDSALMNSTIAFTLNHRGASDFYINGKLINQFGEVSKSFNDETGYYSNSKPIIVNLDSSLLYQISIRYSNNVVIEYPYLYLKFKKDIGFYLTAKNLQNALDFYGVRQADRKTYFAALSGIFISISVIYFLLFLFYSSRSEYFYYTIFTFAISLILANSVLTNIINSSLTYNFISGILFELLPVLALISVLAFLYKIFYGRLLKFFYILCFIGLLSYTLQLFESFYELSNYIVGIFIIINSIEILRVVVVAIKNRKNNSWVIGGGLGVFALMILSLFVLLLTSDKNIDSNIFAMVFLFSIPLSMSIYLARSSSQTQRDLELQLDTVKKLSKEAIEQQKKSSKLEVESQIIKLENERKTKELEEARELQLSMLPKELPNLPNLDIAVYMQTATEVGGDYYDFSTKEDGSLNICLGDATGHGMKAGTLVSMTKSLFTANSIDKSIQEYFSTSNNALKNSKLDKMMMAFAMVNINGNKISMTNAGIPPFYIYRKEKQLVEEIKVNGLPLGAMNNTNYEICESNLLSGDVILMLSDGLPELQNNNNVMYGYDSVISSFQKVANKSSEDIIEYLKTEGSNWTKDKDPDDDVTFVVIKVK